MAIGLANKLKLLKIRFKNYLSKRNYNKFLDKVVIPHIDEHKFEEQILNPVLNELVRHDVDDVRFEIALLALSPESQLVPFAIYKPTEQGEKFSLNPHITSFAIQRKLIRLGMRCKRDVSPDGYSCSLNISF